MPTATTVISSLGHDVIGLYTSKFNLQVISQSVFHRLNHLDEPHLKGQNIV
jgi:hypothetical protein